MRRFVAVLSLAILAAGVTAGAALAKEGGVEVDGLPVGLKPGDPWETTLYVLEGSPALVAEAAPGITIRNGETGRELIFPARPTADPRAFDVRVVFPAGGLWSVDAYDGLTERSYGIGGGQFFVDGTTAPVTPRSAPADAGFPVWPTFAASLALVLAAAGAALFLRRQRLRLSHH
jgi:hypothetical protein